MSLITVQNISIVGLASALPKNCYSGKRISVQRQTASDLAFEAAKNILNKNPVDLNDVGVIVFVTTTPDYRSPATAMVLQKRLQIGEDSLVYDINSGGSGFVHGLQVGSSLLKSVSKNYALILLGDTPSKQFDTDEQNVFDFTDAGSAILLRKDNNETGIDFMNYTSSEDYEKMILKEGGYRNSKFQNDMEPYSGLSALSPLKIEANSVLEKLEELIPQLFSKYLNYSGEKNIDFVLFTHYNESSYKKIKESLNPVAGKSIPFKAESGVPLGSQLPLLIEDCMAEYKKDMASFLLVAFGEGLSVSLARITLNPGAVLKSLRTDSFYSEGAVTHEM